MNNDTINKIRLSKTHNIIGKKYGKLTVVSWLKSKKNKCGAFWLCKCDCGNEKISAGYLLKRGTTNSCGCLKHGRKLKYKKNRNIAIFKKLYNTTVKRRQKNKGWKNLLSFKKFIELSISPCYYCGTVGCLSLKDYASNTVLKYNGIDRVNNLLGYTKENSVSCCKICNTAKNDLTEQDFLNHIEKIYNYKKERYYYDNKTRIGI